MKLLLTACAITVGLLGAAGAQSTSPPAIKIVSPWARATAGAARDGVAYLTIANTSSTDDRLVGISTPVAKRTELHESVTANGVTRMLAIDGVALKAGSNVVLRPGSYMVMLLDLTSPLKVGQTFPMTLSFEKAGQIEIMTKVEKAGAAGPDEMKGMKMD